MNTQAQRLNFETLIAALATKRTHVRAANDLALRQGLEYLPIFPTEEHKTSIPRYMVRYSEELGRRQVLNVHRFLAEAHRDRLAAEAAAQEEE